MSSSFVSVGNAVSPTAPIFAIGLRKNQNITVFDMSTSELGHRHWYVIMSIDIYIIIT